MCKCCQYGKGHKQPHTEAKYQAKKPLKIIHSDVFGPEKPESTSSLRYMVTFIDDYSRYIWVYLIKEKSEVFQKYKEFRIKVESELSHKFRCFRRLLSIFDEGRQSMTADMSIHSTTKWGGKDEEPASGANRKYDACKECVKYILG